MTHLHDKSNSTDIAMHCREEEVIDNLRDYPHAPEFMRHKEPPKTMWGVRAIIIWVAAMCGILAYAGSRYIFTALVMIALSVLLVIDPMGAL